MLGALAEGTTEIEGLSVGADCLATLDCFRRLGVETVIAKADLNLGDALSGTKLNSIYCNIYGKGLFGLEAAKGILDTKNSGTTTRLISGILAGQEFSSILSGDDSLNSRPMKRITKPLAEMGADITCLLNDGCAPLYIKPSRLHGIKYDSPISSAQVKSAILLAGLYSQGETIVTEPFKSRDHTELMLRAFGADVVSYLEDYENTTRNVVKLSPGRRLFAQKITVPGDASSAAFIAASALLTPKSHITIENVGINPTRTGFLRACLSMGADITPINIREQCGERVADIVVKYSELKGTTIEKELVVDSIDELPILAILSAFAKGTTVIKDAAELRVKESDRIAAICDNLTAMGGKVTPTEDGMIIEGGTPLKGSEINCHGDHRIAMSFAIAGLMSDGETTITDPTCVSISFPEFWDYSFIKESMV
jgi:3-phosphoshikimate 1-carboxyvinyltransferase